MQHKLIFLLRGYISLKFITIIIALSTVITKKSLNIECKIIADTRGVSHFHKGTAPYPP